MNARLPASATLDPAHSIGQIAVQLPGATAVFRRFKLDFCCGGQVPLQQAVADKGLDLDTVLAELSALQRSDESPVTGTPAELIDHILARYHEVHRAQLPELVRMARRVEAVHRDNPLVPAGLADVLEAMQADLESHMHKEEAILFPMLKRGGNPFVGQPIAVMRLEHTEHGATLDKLAALTNDATPPFGACNTWRALYAGVAQLSDDLMQHIHLENNILFPVFEDAAEAAAAAPTSGGCGSGGSGCGCGGSRA